MTVVQRSAIDAAARDLLAPHLAAGETLTWAGFPAATRASRGCGGWLVLLVALSWTILAFSSTIYAIARTGLDPVVGLVALVLGAFGAWLVRAAFRGPWAARELAYGATTERLLLLKIGKQPALRAYGPADLALPQRANERDELLDVYFAVDADLDGWLPGGLRRDAKTLDRVGFLGVPPAAAAAVQAVYAARPPAALSSPQRGADEEAPRLAGRGSLAACRTKLAGALAAWQEARQRRHETLMKRFRLIAPLVVAAPLVLMIAAGERGGLVFGLFLTALLGGGALMVRAGLGSPSASEVDQQARQELAIAMLAGWAQDVHPRARCQFALDLGPARRMRPYRFATSPSSKALKTWHRHRWARFAWATACGSLLVVELIDKVKYKSGAEVKREAVLRGWLVPNEAVWHASALEEPFQAGRLRVVPREVEGQRVLAFRAVVGGPEDTAEAIAGLYEALAQRRRPVAR